MTKPRYIYVEFDGWNTLASVIKDKKELALWLKDGSLMKGDIVYEIKTAFEVIKWKDKELVLTERKGEQR